MTRDELERELLAQPVRSLQYMLRRLSLQYPFLPEIVADGVFGERTLEAVMLFQRELHPPVTGMVDEETWNDIRERWILLERKLAEPRPVRLFPGQEARVYPGNEQEFLIIPQAMLRILARYFDGITADQSDGLHGPASVANTRWLQRAAGLEESGIMDRQTWELLGRLYEMFMVKERKQQDSSRYQGRG